MAHDFSEIHMGQRLEHFIKSAKHGSGLGHFPNFQEEAVAQFLDFISQNLWIWILSKEHVRIMT